MADLFDAKHISGFPMMYRQKSSIAHHCVLPLRSNRRGGKGAKFIVINTPRYADSAARTAVKIADLVLIPCRPSALDLSEIQTTAKLVWLLHKPAFVVFTAISPNVPRVYEEVGKLVASFGTPACPIQVPERASFRHASAEGRTVMQYKPGGKAADDSRHLDGWMCQQLNVSTCRRGKSFCMSREPSFANFRDRTPADGCHRCPGYQKRRHQSAPQAVRRKEIAGFFIPQMSFAMHALARRQGRGLQALMAESFNDVLRKHGEGPIGD